LLVAADFTAFGAAFILVGLATGLGAGLRAARGLAPWAGRDFAALFRAGALVEVLREAVLREAVFERDFAIGLVLFLRDQNYGPKRRGRLS
jgi:hypothetical protein